MGIVPMDSAQRVERAEIPRQNYILYNKASITFACHGKRCVLAKIAPPDSSTEYLLGRDSVERNLHHPFGMTSMVSIKLAGR